MVCGKSYINVVYKVKSYYIIKDMYQKVKPCVRSCGKYSDFFEYSVGLRQGEIMSPILFSLFVDDLELIFARKSR